MEMRLPDFGRDEERTAIKAFNGLSNKFFAVAGGVHFRRVDACEAKGDAMADDGGELFVVRVWIGRVTATRAPCALSKDGKLEAAEEFFCLDHGIYIWFNGILSNIIPKK